MAFKLLNYCPHKEGEKAEMGEYENIIDNIQSFELESIGTECWIEQYNQLEKLNNKAHEQALSGVGEFLSDSLTRKNKLADLLESVVKLEFWRIKLMPKLLDRVENPFLLIFPIYYEASIINLLEIVLFHEKSVEGIGNMSLDLIDYIYRSILGLNCFNDQKPENKSNFPNIKSSTLELFSQSEFAISICCLSILRYLVEHQESTNFTNIRRIVEEHDFILLLIEILQISPWKRKNNKGRIEIYEDHCWKSTQPNEQQFTSKAEAQIWLTLYLLLMRKESRSRYHITDFRLSQLKKLKCLMVESLLDEIPILSELLRFIQELDFIPRDSKFVDQSRLMIINEDVTLHKQLASLNDTEKLCKLLEVQIQLFEL